MRRPTFCGGGAGGLGGGSSTADDECACLASSCAPLSPPDEGRLARVKRLLAGSLMARTRRPRSFGVRVAEQPGGVGGVPDVAVLLCGYIENHGLQCGGLFRLSAGKPRLVERLRVQLERSGDADLEGAADAHSAAQLLKLWLRELPEPVVTLAVAERLLAVHHKFATSSLGEWRVAVGDTLESLPAEHLRLLAYLARFLLRCTLAASRQCRHADNIAAVFAPLLLREAVAGARCVVAVELTARILADALNLFPPIDTDRMETEPACVVLEPDSCAGNLRKRKEHNEICGGQDLRKVVRSNSEERALSVCVGDKSSIRRVSSHEDFSLQAKNHHNNNQNHNNNKNSNSFLSELIDPSTKHGVLSLRPGSDICSEEEHERRRRSERECRAAAQINRRPAPRRRRPPRGGRTPPTQQVAPDQGPGPGQQSPLSPVSSSTSEDDGPASQTQDAVSSGHAGTPLRELLHANEAMPSPTQWASTPAQALLSPRGCVPLGGFRGGLDPSVPPSPPQEHSPRSPRSPRSPAQLDSQMKHLHKQTSSVKRKLKRFDERFEREFGYRPSHADKMADREAKHLGAELLRLRKEMKQLKDESPMDADNARSATAMEAALRQVEQHLEDERQASGRPWALTALTPTQTQDEKASVQRALLYLESVGGRPAARAQRDLVRPLYDRYRALKRAITRNGVAASKDSISELATILEHEAMNFSSKPPAALTTAVSELVAHEAVGQEPFVQEPVGQEPVGQEPVGQDTVSDEPDVRQDLENLHSLPLWRLLEQTRAVRDEKRALRRALRDFEADFARRAGRKLQREDRAPHEARYAAYKQAKARLRLLQALASKHTANL